MPDVAQGEAFPEIRRKRPFIVSFSGMDGAGKTTQIDALLIYLHDAGLRVRVLRFWDDIAVAGSMRENMSHKLFKSEKGVGAPDRPVRRRDKNVRAWYMTVARLFLYLLDAAHLSFITATLSPRDADVVILDRYLYDQIVNLNLDNPATRIYARLLTKIVPRPNIPFLLDADPRQARARKPEYPLLFLQRLRASYGILAAWSRLVVIAPLAYEDVTRSVLRSMPRVSLLRAVEPGHSLSLPRSHQ